MRSFSSKTLCVPSDDFLMTFWSKSLDAKVNQNIMDCGFSLFAFFSRLFAFLAKFKLSVLFLKTLSSTLTNLSIKISKKHLFLQDSPLSFP